MARDIDYTKLERIKEATVEMIVSHGYGGASIAMIAKKAGVADGYLYRHFPSKEALVQSLYNAHIEQFRSGVIEIVMHCTDFSEVIRGMARGLFKMANERPTHAKFLNSLMNDYTFLMTKPMMGIVPEIAEKVCSRGKALGAVNAEMTVEEFNAIFPTMLIEYAVSRLRQIFSNQPLDEKDVDRITKLCIKALQ